MAEFASLDHTVAACVNVGAASMVPVTEDDIGVSASCLSFMLSLATRNSNAHTKPPQYSEKLNKKTLERLQQPLSPCHLNPFLRLYMGPNVEHEALRECLHLCACNEPDWVYRCQKESLTLLCRELDGRLSGHFPQVQSDDPPLLLQLRSSLPPLATAEGAAGSSSSAVAVPHVSFTNPHFRYLVDTTLDEKKDRYFSGQVKVKSEAKGSFSVRIAERLTLIDGNPVAGEHSDFQCLLDKPTMGKKGETCTLMLSLIVNPQAVFNTMQELVLLAIEDVVRLVVTFLVINPSIPLFHAPLPGCIFQPVVQSPLGLYLAPLPLQLLKHQFIRQEGFVNKDVSHLLCGFSHGFGAFNRDAVRSACRMRSTLEDEVDVGQLLKHFWVAEDAAASASTAASRFGLRAAVASSATTTSAGSSSSSCAVGHRPPPQSLAQPSGYATGASQPTTAVTPHSATNTWPNVQTIIPDSLLTSSPATIFVLMLMWLSEFPNSVFDASLTTCDPMTYLESLQPWQQGLIRWVLDLCLGLLSNRDTNETNVRSLALTFGMVLLHDSSDYQRLLSDDVPSEAEEESTWREARDDAWRRRMSLRLHCVTAMTHWIALYEPVYQKAMTKK